MTPIKERIAAAYRIGIGYHDLMRLVFPEDQYPRAFNYGQNGGPPGCAMAFGRALREMDGTRDLSSSQRDHVYIPDVREYLSPVKVRRRG